MMLKNFHYISLINISSLAFLDNKFPFQFSPLKKKLYLWARKQDRVSSFLKVLKIKNY